ncbi:MAG: 16S rRNA (guanine(966)-N(2))-methyltransferase RsmD [Oscillospiraceae bacterium]|nr:16S rRNA (guanine(966)-N(2))-methyltransferase RsmD [Oscillospiraceae bacterium]
MRVITGSCRGRRLKTPAGDDVRPTTDNVKEAVFNIIASDVEGRRVLDLFAGTGQLGIEALSRGAREAVFVDSSPASLKIVRENLQLCSMEAQVVRSDAIAYLKHCAPFDLIFVDPPYASGLYEKVLECINLFDILSEGGIIIVEADRDCALPELSPPYRRLREYRYGKVKICTYTKESAV